MIYLNVPYYQKDQAKSLGAKWDPILKKWYVQNKEDYYKFLKWLDFDPELDLIVCDYIYLVVGERECFKCHNITQVIGFAIESYFCSTYTEFNNEVNLYFYNDTVHISEFIDGLPDEVYCYMQTNYNFKLGYSNFCKSECIANHCNFCGVIQGNHYIFSDPPSPFFIDSEEKARNLKLLRIDLPYDLVVENNFSFSDTDFKLSKYAQLFNITKDIFVVPFNSDSSQIEFSVDPAFSSETILEPEYNNLINKNQYKKDLILRKLSFPLMIILSILLGFSAMCIYGKTINPNPTVFESWIGLKISFVYDKLKNYTDAWIAAPAKTKIISLLIMSAFVIVLTLLCKLDTVFRKLPGGMVLKDEFDYDFFELHNILRLIPAFIFMVYLVIRFFKEHVQFDLTHFSLSFEGYNAYQIITQVFIFIILSALFFVLLDSFVSAGIIGGFFQAFFALSANLLLMYLSLFLVGIAAIFFIIAISIAAVFLFIKAFSSCFCFRRF